MKLLQTETPILLGVIN